MLRKWAYDAASTLKIYARLCVIDLHYHGFGTPYMSSCQAGSPPKADRPVSKVGPTSALPIQKVR